MMSGERIMFTANTAGQHHLRVFMASDLGPTIGVPYSLSAQITLAPCAMDSLEPNNARANATPISPATVGGLSICVGDDDFYAVDLSAGQQVTVSVEHSISEGDIDLIVTNALGTSTWSTSGSRTPETISFTASAAGQYIIRVYLTSDPGIMQGNSYTLSFAP
jgi:hypothetical protein